MERRLLYYLYLFKWRYLIGLVTLIGASVFVMLPPLVVRDAIDAIDRGTTRSELVSFCLIILGLALVESVLRFGARQLISGTSRRVEYALRNDLATHLMALDQTFYLRSQTGDIMARCTNDLQRVRDLAGPATLDVLRACLMMIFGFIFMMTIDFELAVIAIAYFPPIVLLIVFYRGTVESKYRAVQDQFGEISNRVQENLSGMRAIKAYAQEESEIATFTRSNRELMRRTMSWSYYMGAFWPLMAFVGGASVALVLWFGGREVVAGRLTIGEFVQFNSYLAVLTGALTPLGWTVTLLQQGLASLRRVTEILAAEPRIGDPAVPVSLERPRGEVEFRNVTAGYGDSAVLKDISIRIEAGATVAIVGGTGAGKTTLAGLIVRLHDPWEGQVLIDGVDVRELSLHELRAVVGFVPQETFLFSESLAENVAYGRPDPPRHELDYAVETSQLVSDLGQLPHGLDTVLGERGVTLSGGQRQRAALARALLKSPPIVILDDALSHVDTHTEEEILKRLRAFMSERTTILIAHRTSTLASADYIVALEDGAIVEVGRHEELIRLHGVYARFFRRQQLAEQLESAPAGNGGPATEAGPETAAPGRKADAAGAGEGVV